MFEITYVHTHIYKEAYLWGGKGLSLHQFFRSTIFFCNFQKAFSSISWLTYLQEIECQGEKDSLPSPKSTNFSKKEVKIQCVREMLFG